MRRLFFTLLFINTSIIAFAQLDAIKPTVKKTTKLKPKPVKPVNPVTPVKPTNTESYIIVFRGGQFAAALNNYNIFIDGRKVCALSNGKYFKYPVSPGKHEIEAKKAGVDLAKKETFASVVSSPGKSNYISFNIKKTLLREKFELNEINQGPGRELVNNLKEDNCQGDIGRK
jgi:hypothetical protein